MPQPQDTSSNNNRSPLDVARLVADRYMQIPRRPTYMWNLGGVALLDLYRSTQDQRYLDYYLEHFPLSENAFDYSLYLATGDERAIAGVAEHGEQLLTRGPRDRDGSVLDPSGRYTVDVFAGQFTTPIVCGHLLGDRRFFDEAARLLEIQRGYMEDPATGVWYSRWGHSMHPNRPNPGLWARGNGWLIDLWGRRMQLWDPAHAAYDEVLGIWQQYCRDIAAFQTESGLYRQLVNRPDCFEEATGSGLFASGFAHGVVNNTLDDDMAAVAWRTFRGLDGLVDDAGNIHNVSTYAGGYNFERQYYSCAKFNDPHGDYTVMAGCIAVHEMLQQRTVDHADPTGEPVLVTEFLPGVLSNLTPDFRQPDDVSLPIFDRALSLESLPEHDLHGGTILGLLHHYDVHQDPAALEHSRRLLDCSGAGLAERVQWNLRCEVAHRVKPGDWPEGLIPFVDDTLGTMPRDRLGIFLDDAGGYRVETLMVWLPLLAKAGAASGDIRYLEEACTQLFGHQRWLEDPLTHLWYSAYGRGMHPRRVTPGLWALGNGYVLAGMVGLLEHLPREHASFADVLCALRNHADVVSAYLPVAGPWTQVIDQLSSFPCFAASGLLTYGLSRSIVDGWLPPTYWASAGGGIWVTGPSLDDSGGMGSCSLPAGGLDRVEDYERHRADNDPAALGYFLSGCAYASRCIREGLNQHITDRRPGAR